MTIKQAKFVASILKEMDACERSQEKIKAYAAAKDVDKLANLALEITSELHNQLEQRLHLIKIDFTSMTI